MRFGNLLNSCSKPQKGSKMNQKIFERKELMDGIFFNAIGETKFKSNLLSVRFITPLCADTAAKNALLFPVLSRGSKGRKKRALTYKYIILYNIYFGK